MKIAILFLTMADVNFPQIWEKFFDDIGGNTNKYSIYCHPKYPEKVTINWMKSNIIKTLVPTEWGHFTNAYVELLKAASRDQSNTHFIFASESCIPIKPLCKLEKFILKYPNSTSFINLSQPDDYNFKKSDLPSNYFSSFNSSNLIKHSGWFCLSRFHTEKLVAHPDVYKFNRIIAGDEHILSLIYSKTDPNIVNFNMTYANWNYSKHKVEIINKKLKELYEYQEKTGKSKKAEIFELRKQKSIAGKHPKTYTKITKKIFDKIVKSKSFFFRKFDKSSSIGKHYNKLLDNKC
jgi:hypothetical protein